MTTPFHWLPRTAVLLALGVVAVLAVAQLEPPAPLLADAPAGDFSAARAALHLRHVARAPHPVGSVEHAAVRDYIVAELTRLGVAPEIQRATVSQDETRAQLGLYGIENIVARLPGTGGSRRALLLVGHYDSVPTGPGASDDGHAVAVLLETLRALRAGPPLARDVLFLFSDGEELGLLGARAFVASNPHRGDVALALNFEARGTGGPGFLFQTSPHSSDLVREFAGAAPYPMASSLLDEVYRRLPNDTDLSVLMGAGIRGMNFAYFDNYPGYHSQRDDIASLDPASLQHQGSHALALARRLGNGDLAAGAAPDATWFSATRRWLIWYPSVVDPLVLAAILVGYVGLIAWGRRRNRLRLRGIATGWLCLAGAMLLWPAISHLWATLAPLGPVSPTGEPRGAGWDRIGCLALTLAGSLAGFRAGLRRASTAELAIGALGGELMIAAGLLAVAPGGAYLLVWPSLLSLLAAAALATAPPNAPPSLTRHALLVLGAAVAIWLLAPWIHLLFMLLTLHWIALAIAVAVALIGFAIPLLLVLTGAWSWRLPAVLAAAGGAVLLLGLRAPVASPAHPASSSIAYALDTDDHRRAHWITDRRPDDPWTSRMIPDARHRAPLDGFFPFTDWTFYQAPAPVADLPAPAVTVLDNRVDGDVRRLRLCVRSGGPAEAVLLYAASAARVRGVELEGRRFDRQRPSATARWAVRYAGAPRDGFDLILETDASAPVSLRAVDQYFGLGGVPAPRRPDELIETPSGFGPSDQTYVGRTFAQLQLEPPGPAAHPACMDRTPVPQPDPPIGAAQTPQETP